MDPVTVIVSALAAGSGAAATDMVSAAVKDSYAALQERVRRLFSGRPAAEEALTGHEADPAAWEARLADALVAAGAAKDGAMLAAARDLLSLVDQGGAPVGGHVVDLRNAKGVQVGDGNTQHNTFS